MASSPREENRVPGLVAKSDADNTPVILEADAATKRLKVSAVITSGGSGGAQYTDGDATIAHPIGTIPVYDKAGTITAVSVANPLPVSATISTTGLATSANQTTEITSLATIAALSKAEDAPHSSNDTGIPVWAVRNDTGAVFAGSDGDYIPLATDATGALRVDLNGTISTNNSTTVALAGGAAFTGTSEDALNYNEIRISVIASHVSASDGLSIQQSEDNTNWDFTDTYTIPANTGKTYSVPRQARYFRVVYTNGATLQTSFRLQTILNRLGARVSSQRPNDAYTNETDLEQQQAFLMGYNGSTWDRLRTIGTGILSTSTVLTAGSASIGSVMFTDGTGSGNITTQNLVPAGTATVGSAVEITVSAGYDTLVTQTTGTYTGALSLQGTVDGTTWITFGSASVFYRQSTGVFNGTIGSAVQDIFQSNISGMTKVRVTALATVSGTAVVSLRLSMATSLVALDAPLPAGSNVIGAITTIIPATSATNLGKAEDAAHTTGDVGVFSLGVRNDTLLDTTNTTADYTQLSTDIKGRVMTAGAPRALKGIQQTSVSNTTSETTIITAIASTFLDVYGIILANTGASTTKVTIKDATAGTTRIIIEVPTLETRGFMLPVDSAVPQSAVNNNWTVTCGTATTNLEVTAMYVKMV